MHDQSKQATYNNNTNKKQAIILLLLLDHMYNFKIIANNQVRNEYNVQRKLKIEEVEEAEREAREMRMPLMSPARDHKRNNFSQ